MKNRVLLVLVGIGLVLFVIVGVVLVFVFFGAGSVEPNLFQTCLSAPDSPGCDSCKVDGLAGGNCNTCETFSTRISGGETLDPGEQIQFNNLCR